MNHMHILDTTTHCGIHLNITNLDLFLDLSKHSNPVKVLFECEPQLPICQNWNFFCHLGFKFYWCQATAPEHHGKLYFTSCPYILGNNQLDQCFLCKLLTAYTKLKYSWRKNLPLHSECILKGPILWVLWQTAMSQNVCTTCSCQPNVYG